MIDFVLNRPFWLAVGLVSALYSFSHFLVGLV